MRQQRGGALPADPEHAGELRRRHSFGGQGLGLQPPEPAEPAEPVKTAWELARGFVLLAMPNERVDGRLERIRAPDPLKLSRNLAVTALGIIAALAADQLVQLGAAVIRPAAEGTGGPLPEAERPVSIRKLTHVCLPRNGSGRASP